MGNSESLLPRTDESFPYFCASFRRGDRLLLVHANREIEQTFKEAINKWKDKGLEERFRKTGGCIYKLSGNPFTDILNSKVAESEGRAAKVFLCNLLTDLAHIGWYLRLNPKLSVENDSASWFFEKDTPSTNVICVCVSLVDSDKIQLVNASDALRAVFKASLAHWLRSEKVAIDCYEVTVNGHPWKEFDRYESVAGSQMLLSIVRGLHTNGFRICGAFSSQGHPDSIFFQQRDGMVHEDDCDCFCALSLNGPNVLRLVDCGLRFSDGVKNAIARHWSDGIDKFKFYEKERFSEARLSGSPWLSEKEEQAGRLLICKLIETFSEHGWTPYMCVQTSIQLNEQCTLILRQTKPAPIKCICILPAPPNQLRIINALKLADSIVETVNSHWPIIDGHGWMKERAEHELSEAYRVKLAANPWEGVNYMETMVARHLVMALLVRMRSLGFTPGFCATLIVRNLGEEKGIDSLFFTDHPEKSVVDAQELAESLVESIPRPKHYKGEEAKSAMATYVLKTTPSRLGM